MQKSEQNNRGITLISLIILIIVLLVLASITLSSITGEESVIKHAQNAQASTEMNDDRNQGILENIINIGTEGILGDKLGVKLVNLVEIGDYVDIGIDYTNTKFYRYTISGKQTTSVDYSSTNGLTGWRVLSKKDGVIKLISAGTPLCYNHNRDRNASVANLANLNTTLLEGVANSTMGFTASGFSGNTYDLASIWATNSHINASSAHAITEEELIDAYKQITGNNSVTKMMDLYDMPGNPLITSEMHTAAENAGGIMSVQANDLLGIGSSFWLGGKVANSSTTLWSVYTYGDTYPDHIYEYGVRIIIELKPETRVNISDKTIDGSTLEKAYVVCE